MYYRRFSPALTASLRQLAETIPQLKKDIQEGLLKTLSLVLMGRVLVHPGAPRNARASVPNSASLQSLSDPPDVGSITLALRTLGSFNFESKSLMIKMFDRMLHLFSFIFRIYKL